MTELLSTAGPVAILSKVLRNKDVDMKDKRKAQVERYFRGVYGGEPSVVDDLASEHVISSYPVFARLFNTRAIRGREAVKAFIRGFGSRWTDAQITIHEAVEEGDRVVILWSFRGRNIGSAQPDEKPTNQEHGWGGITLFRFDGSGKIVEEIGEESAPGPVERLEASEVQRKDNDSLSDGTG